MALSFRNFTDWLFPFQDVGVAYHPNPTDLPDDVGDILQQVSADTKIPYDWLVSVAGRLVNGFAGLQCLWYLHGLEGKLELEDDYYPEWVPSITLFLKEELAKDPDEVRRGIVAVVNYGLDYVNWQKGTVEVLKRYQDRESQRQTVKLGKWLERYIMAQGIGKQEALTMRYDLKNRAKDKMRWAVSAHPYDVLTMSFNRPWSSCMRPGSDYDWQYGILTDLAAGSAMMFFYCPGADTPCGRLTLRPALDENGQKVIVSGRTIYGVGPRNLAPQTIEVMLAKAGAPEIPVAEYDLCRVGSAGRMLSRMIFSDVGRGGCEQDDEDYEKAYVRLAQSGWPEPRLDVGQLRAIAEGHFDEFGHDVDVLWSVPNFDYKVAAHRFVSATVRRNSSPIELLDWLNSDGRDLFEAGFAWLRRELFGGMPSSDIQEILGEDAVGEFDWACRGLVETMLYKALAKCPTLLLAYRDSWEELPGSVTDFLTAYKRVAAIWEWVTPGLSTKTQFYPELPGWYPESPDYDVAFDLGLTNQVRPERLYLPPDDPRQLTLFTLDPYAVQTVVALWLDEGTQKMLDEDAKQREDGIPEVIAKADRSVQIPPGGWDWDTFIQRSR